jgi:hypothetical protein
MTDLHDNNRSFVVINHIEDAVITLANAEFVLAGQLFTAEWVWFAGEALNPIRNLPSNFEGQGFKLFGSGRFDEELIVCHDASDL